MFPFIMLIGLGYVLHRASTPDPVPAPSAPAAPAPLALPPAPAPPPPQMARELTQQPSPGVPVEVAMALAYESDVNKLEALARRYDASNQVVSALLRQRIAFLQAMDAASGQQALSYVTEQQMPAQQYAPQPVSMTEYVAASTPMVSGHVYNGPRPMWLPPHVAWPPVMFNPQFHHMG